MGGPSRVALAIGEAGVFSNRAPKKETPNEDSTALIPVNRNSAVLVVADGMGGSAGGDRASALAINKLREELRRAARGTITLRAAILNGFEKANRDILKMAIGAATTMAVVEIEKNRFRPYHVGDSMILVVGGRGKMKHQTISHSPIGYGVEAGLLDEDEAMRHKDRHLVSNVVGSPEMHIAIGPSIQLSDRDTAILASDGLFDNLSVNEIVETIRKGPLLEAAGTLAKNATERMSNPTREEPAKPDDLSFIVFRPASRKPRQ